MPPGIERALSIVERLEAAKTPSTAGRAFFDALAPMGAKGFGARAYVAGGGSSGGGADGSSGDPTFVFAQVLPPKWNGSPAARYIESLDPLPAAARTLGRPAFLWSDASPRSDPKWTKYWSALAELGLGEGTAVHFFAPNGMTSRVSVGFGRTAFEPGEQRAIELASYALLNRLQMMTPAKAKKGPALSERERDCLAFVARGLSDADIADKLDIAQSTAHFYIEKAKRKLGAKTRAQAVAHLIAAGLF
jgi:DNA-binding CsgD family transcriptional regulator